jgi:phosphate-selective porin OprO/OprP
MACLSHHHRRYWRGAATLLALVAASAAAEASQAPDPQPAPALQDTPVKPEPPPKTPFIEIPRLFQPGGLNKYYAVPDLAPDRLLLPRLNTPVLTVRPGIELIADVTGFRQDDTSRAQVGEQTGVFEVRSASIELLGEIGLKKRLGYKVGIAYNGFNVNPESTFAVTDAAVNLALPKWRTMIYTGQMRQDFGYEVVGSIATMPQSERIISTFAAPVNPGVKVIHVLDKDNRMTVSYGLYKNDWGEGDGGLSFNGRVTRLMIDDPQRRRFLHLGMSIWLSGDNPAQRYFGRPGVDAADVYVDTGEFASKRARHVGVEAHYSHGPWSVLGELVTVQNDAPDVGNPRFNGFYVMGSWVVTGESRPYDRSRAALQRIIPEGRWGALELVTRLAMVDLDDAGIAGGSYVRLEAGANWWATTRWKFGVLYGHVWLDRFGKTGNTDSLLTRLQWVY